jgi:quercetin dioxygenase-like cupin family protein
VNVDAVSAVTDLLRQLRGCAAPYGLYPEVLKQYCAMRTTTRPAFITMLALLPLARISGQPGAEIVQATDMGLHSPANIEWKAGPASLPAGAKMAALEGDPTKDGPFVMRLQAPDGYHIPPHTHPKTERVTVISGKMLLAMGDNLDRSAATTLPAGTYGFWPAGMKHTAWFDGETIIQIHGVGPWQINYVNPADDPRNAKKSP